MHRPLRNVQHDLHCSGEMMYEDPEFSALDDLLAAREALGIDAERDYPLRA